MHGERPGGLNSFIAAQLPASGPGPWSPTEYTAEPLSVPRTM